MTIEDQAESFEKTMDIKVKGPREEQDSSDYKQIDADVSSFNDSPNE